MNVSNDLSALLGPTGWLSDPDETAPFSRDWLDRYGVPPLGVARPASTEETAGVLQICHEAGVPVVPQGGRTGLVGASVAPDPGCLLLSLSRLNGIHAIDDTDFTAVVGAGVVLGRLHEALENHDLQFPLHLGAEGSAQIGGLIATNAGGSHAFRYGTMQDLVLGLEVVLPNGQIWKGDRRLIKDNSGFQLRKLFCGSEGRLGVITRAVLRLYPASRNRATALVAIPDLSAALQVGRALRHAAGDMLTALEFFDDDILGLTLRHVPDLQWPMGSRANFYLLIELASAVDGLDLSGIAEQALEEAVENELALDAVLAQSISQRAMLWRIREELPEGTLREGRQLKHDIAVPVSRMCDFIQSCAPEVQAILPGARIWTFGHLADGNIHYNISPPEGQPDFDDLDESIALAVYQTVEAHGGSFAAEHGTGRTKPAIANKLRTSTERHLMARVHEAIDPQNIMNPGVVI